MLTDIVSIAIGVLAGILSGLFGLAGGTIIVPGLMVLGGLSQLAANGTSLAANLLPVGILGAVAYGKRGLIRVRVILPLAAGLVLGVWGGAFLASSLPSFGLKAAFGVFLLLLSLRFFLFRSSAPAEAADFPPSPWWGLSLAGAIAGIFSGLFGIGGGAIMVPIMTEFFRFSQRQATASSLAALLLPVGIVGVLHYNAQGEVQWLSAGLLAVGLILGIFLGAKLHLKSPEKAVRVAYGSYLGLIGLGFVVASVIR